LLISAQTFLMMQMKHAFMSLWPGYCLYSVWCTPYQFTYPVAMPTCIMGKAVLSIVMVCCLIPLEVIAVAFVNVALVYGVTVAKHV
jgi:hypothetical protein